MQLLPLLALSAALPLPFASGITITTSAADVTNKTYDYVIVGGGLAGLVVASRLTEVSNVTVLVIEAGQDQRINTVLSDPSAWVGLASSQWSWNATTIPQSVGGRSINLGQGIALGGSTCINGLQWNRGHKSQYDAMEILGSPGWNWNSLFKYMKKAENFVTPSADQVSRGAGFQQSAHSTTGPLPVGFPTPYNSGIVFGDFITAATQAAPNLTGLTDLGSGSNNGVGRNLFSLKPGAPGTVGGNLRSTSANAYIYPFMNSKPGLTILLGHLASGIIWGGQYGGKARAVGVNFIPTPTNNATVPSPFSVSLNKEVIVAAGAIGSPHFLQLSGIGNRTILNAAGITTKVDLPAVGTNLQDHALTTQIYAMSSDVEESSVDSSNAPGAGAVVFPNLYQLLGQKRAKAFGDILNSTIKARARAMVASGGFSSQKGAEKMLRNQMKSMVEQNAPVAQITFAAIIKGGPLLTALWGLLPQQRGTVHVVSSNPSVRPRIDVGYLLEPLDLEIHIKTVNMSRAIFSTAPLSRYVTSETAPGLATLPINASENQFRDWIVGSYDSGYHPLGSVPMMPEEDGGAVDSMLLVYGTRNVRVVDSSIIPVQVSANPSGTVYGVAEKAADVIKEAM